ncbi:hypothetical protein K501DRAFT_328833 [Backusella circina FSU 941]|nr:hypothetical protein K501DRAFT_328833 [Backusella circina FSU 941]
MQHLTITQHLTIRRQERYKQYSSPITSSLVTVYMTLRALRAIHPHCKSSIYGFSRYRGRYKQFSPIASLQFMGSAMTDKTDSGYIPQLDSILIGIITTGDALSIAC